MFVFLSTLAVVLFLLPIPASSHDAANHKPVLEYHGGPVLNGDMKISAIWYGTVGLVQESAIRKFIRSLNKDNRRGATCVGMVEDGGELSNCSPRRPQNKPYHSSARCTVCCSPGNPGRWCAFINFLRWWKMVRVHQLCCSPGNPRHQFFLSLV
uniref:Uncharacterized protein n=1 Tax=Nelumbo nucifera TaxID=4432 RepID=A0A822ZU23_NELNU|nr:TPA_asm: hypothetical protein HUJ06_016958 [Nelumbo nucifera]